jgi:hypothetical protein
MNHDDDGTLLIETQDAQFQKFTHSPLDIVNPETVHKISKGVLRKKLSKMRHLVIEQGINPHYLDSIFPTILKLFKPQTVQYNGGIANVKQWKISTYLEVMEGGIPCTNPDLETRALCLPLLEKCDQLFAHWYKQQHACNNKRNTISKTRTTTCTDAKDGKGTELKCERLMTFITRYTPAPGEQALLKHVDGAGKVDGSVVVALPIDRWSASEEVNSFEGHGGGLTFWGMYLYSLFLLSQSF